MKLGPPVKETDMANKSEMMAELETQSDRCKLHRSELEARLNRLLEYRPETAEGKSTSSKLEQTLNAQLIKINNDLSVIKRELEVATLEHLVSGEYSDEEPAANN